METDGASALWLLAVMGGPVILAVVLIYGIWQWRHRQRRADELREAATRTHYREGDAPQKPLVENETRL